jgi:hypothetical protein
MSILGLFLGKLGEVEIEKVTGPRLKLPATYDELRKLSDEKMKMYILCLITRLVYIGLHDNTWKPYCRNNRWESNSWTYL